MGRQCEPPDSQFHLEVMDSWTQFQAMELELSSEEKRMLMVSVISIVVFSMMNLV